MVGFCEGDDEQWGYTKTDNSLTKRVTVNR
jgi:hypothetical protein